ncbi:MAG: hypothetical protein WBN40_03110 [Pseudomonadales bacterium]
MQPASASTNFYGLLAACWAITGFSLLMLRALQKLLAISIDAFDFSFTILQWAVLLAIIIFMAYSEGYRGFQKGFSPRFAARMRYLLHSGSTTERLLAPLYCMNFFNAPRKRMLVSYSVLLAILLLIFIFQMIPQPWRGILDAGVVVGLAWGLASTLYLCAGVLLSNGRTVQTAEGS